MCGLHFKVPPEVVIPGFPEEVYFELPALKSQLIPRATEKSRVL